MMTNKVLQKFLIIAAVLIAGFGFWKISQAQNSKKTVVEEIRPDRGNIEVVISTTGTVQPQNRLEIKPPINGRVEEILVKEGDQVKKGQIVAWMSSIDRAALLDAARPKGEETLKYWEEAYKPTPLIAPIDGDIIVRAVEPGQTVTSSDPVVVLSDRLIVKAQVDETDIGRVQMGQTAEVSLDAYPKKKVGARVDHISYESKLVSNVTIYEVDILPEEVPVIFRSGMTANVNIVEENRENILRLPLNAVRRGKEGETVLMKTDGQGKPQIRKIETGISDDVYIEILSGVNENDIVVMEISRSGLPKKNSAGTNPFMPSRQRNR